MGKSNKFNKFEGQHFLPGFEQPPFLPLQNPAAMLVAPQTRGVVGGVFRKPVVTSANERMFDAAGDKTFAED